MSGGFCCVVEFGAVLLIVAGVAGVAGTGNVNPAGVTAGVVAEETLLDLAGVCNNPPNRVLLGVFAGVLVDDRDGVRCIALRRLLSQTS